MPNNQTPTQGQSGTVGPLTQAESELILQLRRLQLKREGYVPPPGRQAALGLIKYEGRSYLEIRQGLSPIMVPAHLQLAARNCLSENIRRYALALAPAQAQAPARTEPVNMPTPLNSPPLSPVLNSPAASVMFDDPHSVQNYTVTSPGSDMLQHMQLPASQGHEAMSALSFTNSIRTRSTPSPAPTIHASDISFGLASPPHMESVPEDETKPVPAASSSKTVDEKPAKSAKISRHRRSASAGSACHSTTQRKTSPASSVGSIDELEEMSNRSDNSDDLNDTVCVKAEESDASEDQLRKPPNAFILYRKDKNKNLRSEQPGISVESASAIIGKLWREEAEDVKAHYKKIAQEERDKYFARKKKLQARLKRKKAEREGPGSPQQSRAASAKPKSEPVVKSEVREIIVPQSHTLSSLSPEAHSHMSFGAPTDGLFGAALPRSPRHARSFTFGAGMQQLTSLALDTHGLVSSEATGMPLSPALGRFNTDLGLGINFGMGTSASMDSLGQLGLQLGQPLSPTSMELDIAVTTAAALQSLTAMSTGDSSIVGWPTSQPSAQSEFDGMLNSLFQGDN